MGKRWEVDGKISGLGVLVLPSGVKTWYLRFYEPSGKQVMHRLGRVEIVSKTAAREEAHKILAAVARGEAPCSARQELRKGATVADLVKRMKEVHYKTLRPSSVVGYKGLWKNHMLPVIGEEKVATLTTAKIAQMTAKMPRIQANRGLAVLKSAMNFAEQWEMRPRGSNPCHGVKRNPERKRRRYLKPTELPKLLKACEKFAVTKIRWRFIQLVKLLLLTGARRDEIRAARWEWFDEEAGLLVIPPEHHKTGRDGKERTIFLSPPALRLLKDLRKQSNSSWIIPGDGDKPLVGVPKMWHQLLQSAGIDHLWVHDLRRSYASIGLSSGVSLDQIGELLGHASPQTTAGYAFLIEEAARDAVALIGQKIKNPR